MTRVLMILLVLVVAAAGATWWRYQSFDPCDWMVRDAVLQSGLPPLVVEARLRAELLLKGVTSPNTQECVVQWWRVRQDGLPAPAE